MTRVTHRELRNQIDAIMLRVGSGETFEITKGGKVVAILMAPGPRASLRVIEARIHGRFGELVPVVRSETTDEVLS